MSSSTIYIENGNLNCLEIAIEISRWADDVFQEFIPWPLIFLVIFVWMIRSRTFHRGLATTLPLLRRLKVGNFAEIELNEETRNQFEMRTSELNNFIDAYRRKIREKVRTLVDQKDIDALVRKIVEDDIAPFMPNEELPKDFRCTIHVPDFILKDRLYQLTDYYPGNGNKDGRSFSIRYGVIGRAYRSEFPSVKEQLLPRDQAYKLTEKEQLQQIAADWGLTREEARNVLYYPSYCAIPFYYGDMVVGIFYMDSTQSNAFGVSDDDKKFTDHIQNKLEERGIAEKIEEIRSEMRGLYARTKID